MVKKDKLESSSMEGRVVSVKLPGSPTVLVERQKMHPLYHKSFRRSKKYQVDDALGVSLGDIVRIVKIAPISKRKHFRVSTILGKDIVAVVSLQLKEEAATAIAEVMPVEVEEVKQVTSELGSQKEKKGDKN